jgi:hypothetical protein
MSSNRSISGARQRRAGEPVPSVGPRSNTSIGSQPAFAKQQIQQQQRHPIQQQQQRGAFTQPPNIETLEQVQGGKLSIPKAFTLVTLRLGRIEQYIQQLQEEGVFQNEDKQGEAEVDETIMKNILSRIELLEKNANSSIPLENNGVKELSLNFSKLEKDMRETKDLLLMMMMKYEKLAFISEKNIPSENKFQEEENIEILDNIEEEEEEEDNIGTIVPLNLKEVIEKELASDI